MEYSFQQTAGLDTTNIEEIISVSKSLYCPCYKSLESHIIMLQ